MRWSSVGGSTLQDGAWHSAARPSASSLGARPQRGTSAGPPRRARPGCSSAARHASRCGPSSSWASSRQCWSWSRRLPVASTCTCRTMVTMVTMVATRTGLRGSSSLCSAASTRSSGMVSAMGSIGGQNRAWSQLRRPRPGRPRRSRRRPQPRRPRRRRRLRRRRRPRPRRRPRRRWWRPPSSRSSRRHLSSTPTLSLFEEAASGVGAESLAFSLARAGVLYIASPPTLSFFCRPGCSGMHWS
mmetsp:Transcript_182906/g.579487  ORF Transcript_182906/g.579487 Transcript_182906/m.579487 type:complete len:243 (-) Transcript_182906:12-740(-)